MYYAHSKTLKVKLQNINVLCTYQTLKLKLLILNVLCTYILDPETETSDYKCIMHIPDPETK